ncbi:ROK family transcriptional regulator [Mesorhizobium sp. LHD-90]|uniref:ROK family transcriptional regulator n=1 Tax=Mesorhizobium sp. LHD-90 TaxID=3071414 RepID=UPI0027DF422C|nr:ROK family transcriptional regulator [Mesorhizobium sp. LHD-90]MDQ6433827.1 ROK family transcriptional regulator [Mesorhizobium sp. LHD-90]
MKRVEPHEAAIRATFTSSARSVFRKLFAEGPATRPQLCAALDLSRPTMSSSIGELERVGYVEKIGEIQGALGRKAGMYRLGAGAGHVIAVDAGSTHVRLRVSTLDRRLLHHRVYRLASNQRYLGPEISQAVAEEIEAVRAETEKGWGKLRALGIALPSRVVEDDTEKAATRQENLFSHFKPPADVPLLLENNVNCAAIAEQSHGVARGHKDFAYIQVGVKIGMGVVLGGRLIRGRSGAAGEISHLPYPWGPGQKPENGALEDHVGAEALMQRVRAAWPGARGPAPADTAALFALAGQGDEDALSQVRRHAEDIGAIVSACVGVIDPGLFVLGGGIGSNPLMLPTVRETVQRLSYPTDIESSLLGHDATVLGIEKIAADHACEMLVGTVTD